MLTSSKQNFIKTINHRATAKGSCGFWLYCCNRNSCADSRKAPEYYGLEKKPVKVIEPYQMLGEIDSELIKAMGIDVIGLFSAKNMFGVPNENWKIHKTPWGQEVLFPGNFNYTYNNKGDILMYPKVIPLSLPAP